MRERLRRSERGGTGAGGMRDRRNEQPVRFRSPLPSHLACFPSMLETERPARREQPERAEVHVNRRHRPWLIQRRPRPSHRADLLGAATLFTRVPRVIVTREPKLVAIVRHFLRDELNHRFSGIFPESGYP
jgi:hypothetical protein